MIKNKSEVRARELKIETVKTLAEKMARAGTLTFADYRGLTVSQLGSLRRKVKEAGGEILVAKNTLLRRALWQNKVEVRENLLSGPTAMVVGFADEIAPIRVIAESAKASGLPKFKFGFFGKTFLDVGQIENLASIPSREILHARLVRVLISPISGLTTVLGANIRNLIVTLDQISKIKV